MKVKKIKSRKIYLNTFYALCFMAMGWYLNNRFSPSGNAGWVMETPSVQIQGLVTEDVAAKKKYIAQVEAINSVDIIPQVSGYVEKIFFQNGAEVKVGDVLFLIEQERYQYNLKAAQATRKQLEADYHRLISLHDKKFISDKELETAESNLKNAEAAEDLAKLNLEYTEVKSPINGVIGKALVTIGNLVNANSQKLARIVQTDPIRVVFSVTDKERSVFLQKLEEAEDVFVDIVLPNGEVITDKAQNLFFNNEVNAETATIPVYIDTKNTKDLLVPGNYVDIFIRFTSKKMALLVPQVALAEDASGTYVMTVVEAGKDENGEVKYVTRQKYIQLGDVLEDKQVVLSGLNKEDKVVVQGLQKVRDNGEVHPIFVDTEGKE